MKLVESRVVLTLSVLLVTACASATPGDPHLAEPSACVRTSDCPPQRVCDAAMQECVESLVCAVNADCGADAYCDNGGCARSTAGVACDGDDDCYPGDACFSGHCGCAGDTFAPERVESNVVIVLDRSQSMTASGGADSKWKLAAAAVDSMVGGFGSELRFGLALYSSDGAGAGEDPCAPGQVDVETGVGTAAQISAALESVTPEGRTPIGATLGMLSAYDGLKDPSRANYVLLLTDGQESCGGAPATAAAALLAQSSPVRTFVVGFGNGVDGDSLNAIAAAGGTDAGRAGNRYYQADDGASLQDAFDEIATSVLGCSFDLPAGPASASQLWVYVGDQEVPQASPGGDGWSYDPMTARLTLAGPSCDALASGIADRVSFVRGCPDYVP